MAIWLNDQMEKREIGQIGEGIACKYLKKQGFEIIERNYLRKCGELDVVAFRKPVVHFIEVKTVSREREWVDVNHETWRPEDNVHVHKLRRLRRVIQLYLVERHT